MSKPESQRVVYEDSAVAVRYESVTQLKKDFKGDVPEDESHYDRRVYFEPATQTEYYPWMFSKTLEHNSTTGFPKKEDVDKVVNGWKYADQVHLDAIPKSSVSTRKLEGVAASQSFNLIGTDSSVPYASPEEYHKVDSEKGVYEMAEVYSMALLRDVSFHDIYNDNVDLTVHTAGLNSFSEKTVPYVISGQNLHRGIGPDEDVGPYISQFLYLPFNYGNIPVTQKYYSEGDYEGSVTPAGWLAIQNGAVEGSVVQSAPKYVHNGRVLGAKVHNDPVYQFYYNAALIALENGISPSAFSHENTTAWTSGGGPDILASVAHVALGALRVAWHNKMAVGMKIRPEVYAQRIDLAYEQPESFVNSVPGLKYIKDKCDERIGSLLTEVADKNAEVVPPEFTAGTRVTTQISTEFGYTRFGTTPNSEEYKSYNENDFWTCSSLYDANGDYSANAPLTTTGVTTNGSYTRLDFPSSIHITKVKIGGQSNIVNGSLHFVRYTDGVSNTVEQFVATPGTDFYINVDVDQVDRVYIQANSITPGESNAKYGGIKFSLKATRYLKMQFPEGSPTHPSWPAGHAVIAGACVTVLKAMFDIHNEDGSRKDWPLALQHSIDGDSLVAWGGSGASMVGEFNKLASNVSLGRDWAAVHFRADSDGGMRLGEQYAITYLVDKAKEYHECNNGLFNGFLLEKFDGTKVMIGCNGVGSA